MLLGIMALYVGAVLCVKGIWLTGQARAAERASARPRELAAAGAGALEAEPAVLEDVSDVKLAVSSP